MSMVGFCPWTNQDAKHYAAYEKLFELGTIHYQAGDVEGSGLNISHNNILSLNNTIEKLEECLTKLPFKLDIFIICLSGTGLNDSNHKYVNLTGCTLRYNDCKTNAGGSGIYVSNHIAGSEVKSLQMNICNCEDV